MSNEHEPGSEDAEQLPLFDSKKPLQDKISVYHNSNGPKFHNWKEPGPPKIYQKWHHSRRKHRPTKAELFELVGHPEKRKIPWGERNNDKMTPLDEFPEFGYDRE